MTDARDFTADVLAGRRTRVDDAAPRGVGSSGTTDEVFAAVRESLDALEALRATDRARALEEFRGLVGDKTLGDGDLDSFIGVWRTAIDRPEQFEREVRSDRRGVGDWWDHLRAYLHRPVRINSDERTILDGMKARYRLPEHLLAAAVNPHERLFETYDPAWVPLARLKLGERDWPAGLVDMPRHSAAHPFVYTASVNGAPLAAGASCDIALVSDFGTGYYHSWGIAEQLKAWALPYTFHLGDVYYAGRPEEFATRFELPLFDVVERTCLFGLAENHELYSGGTSYLDYFQRLRERGRAVQDGSYFCVRFPDHQVIGIDVNWQNRRRYRDPAQRSWLADRLGEAGHRTNILLTGSAPFEHGVSGKRDLLDDLWDFVRDGSVHLWFWGDDHYAALFDRHAPEVPFYGSCIGHGGYPGARPKAWQATYKTSPLWLEDAPRFPTWTRWRDDMTNNGWCHATLRPGGGVDLVYVDWLWCKRAAVSLAREGSALVHGPIAMFDRDDAPELHEPG